MNADTRVANGSRRLTHLPIEVILLVGLTIASLVLTNGLNGTLVVGTLTAAAPLLLNGCALIVVYRSCGYINLAQVQIGALAALTFDAIVRGSKVLFFVHWLCADCVSYVPGPVSRSINFALAAIVCLPLSGLLSWLTYQLVMRRFAGRPVLMCMVVTAFLAQAYAALGPQITKALVDPDDESRGRALAQFDGPLNYDIVIAGSAIKLWHLIMVVVAVVVLILLIIGLRRGPWGLALRAGADNPDRARTVGIDAARVAARAWFVAGVLSGLASILPAMVGGAGADKEGAGLRITSLVLVLTLLVFARFTNLWLAGAAALVLSLFASAQLQAFRTQDYLNAMLVLLIGTLLLAQREIGGRVDRQEGGLEVAHELRPIPRELAAVDRVRDTSRMLSGAGLALLIGLPLLVGAGGLSKFIDAAIFGIVAVSMLVLTGWAGQVSLGQFGFVAIGGWVTAASGLPLGIAAPLAICVGALVAGIVGATSLRLTGPGMIVATLTFAVSAEALLLSPKMLGRFLPESLAAPQIFGLDLSSETTFYYVMLALLGAVCVAIVGLRRSRIGRAMIASRSNAPAAQSFGLDPMRLRLLAFVIAGALGGLAGALSATHLGRLVPSAVSAQMSLTVLLFAVVGGLGGLAGPLLGTVLYASLTFFFSSNALLVFAASGLGAVLLLMAAPGGLADIIWTARDATLLRMAYRLGIPVPSLMGDGGMAAMQGRAHMDDKRAQLRRPGEDPLPRYRLDGQWALDRLGDTDTARGRIGD